MLSKSIYTKIPLFKGAVMSLSGISRFAIVLGIAAFTFSGCGEVAEENEDNAGGLTKYLKP